MAVEMHTLIQRIRSAGGEPPAKVEYAVGCYIPQVYVEAGGGFNTGNTVAGWGWNEIAVFTERDKALRFVNYLNGGEWSASTGYTIDGWLEKYAK